MPHACGFGVRNLDGTPTDSTIPAMDLTVQAHSGSMSTTGNEADPPMKSGTAFIDFLGGTHLYGAIATALVEVERTGRGRSVEVAMAGRCLLHPGYASQRVEQGPARCHAMATVTQA